MPHVVVIGYPWWGQLLLDLWLVTIRRELIEVAHLKLCCCIAPPVGVDNRQSISTGRHEEIGICLVRVCGGGDDENGFCRLLTFS
jgi:hypothetical protein